MNRRGELRRPPANDRRSELIKALGVRRIRAGERVDALHKGKVVGPPWLGGIFQTRLNWGSAVLAFGFILFITWLILMRQTGG